MVPAFPSCSALSNHEILSWMNQPRTSILTTSAMVVIPPVLMSLTLVVSRKSRPKTSKEARVGGMYFRTFKYCRTLAGSRSQFDVIKAAMTGCAKVGLLAITAAKSSDVMTGGFVN